MPLPDDLLHTLRTWHRAPAGQLVERLRISRATLKRAVDALGPSVVALGRARRTAYAARRALRGSMQPLPLFEVDPQGRLHEVAKLLPTYPDGCAVEFGQMPAWPLDEDMRDGWFDGVPYFLDDMRPQGFLGRNFARHYAALLQVSEHPQDWSEDDVLHALSLLGIDQPGSYILGETACRQWLEHSRHEPAVLSDEDVEAGYPALAEQAMNLGVVGSSAGGEFPKFTAMRSTGGVLRHVLVKFSGSDDSAGTRRWSDLLVCEHLASNVVAQHLLAGAAGSRIYQAAGRTFLEVDRFDRHGHLGRSPVCSWAALNAALFGTSGLPWTAASTELHGRKLIDAPTQSAIDELWHFGRLIANTDMHDGNLSFRPGLALAPAYDMLPMLYAPARGVELPSRHFSPQLPLPAERPVWTAAAVAAQDFWLRASGDPRISDDFRRICERNHRTLVALVKSA
jgi:hypothetical protein